MPQHDDHDDFAALDFSAHDSGSDGAEEFDALNFSGTSSGSDGAEESAAEALNEYAPAEPDDTANELGDIQSAAEATDEEEENEEDGIQLFMVTNPPETVSVSALIDGRTQQVRLSPKVTGMTESELANEILVIAELARQKGLAGQHSYLLENASLSESLRDMGFDSNEVVRDIMENGVGLTTPEQAAAAQAEVFATRYTADK